MLHQTNAVSPSGCRPHGIGFGEAVRTWARITAAVVGVVLNLALWFGLHVLFGRQEMVHWLGAAIPAPVLASAYLPSVALASAALIAVFRFKSGMVPVLAACVLAGVIRYLMING